MILNPLNFFLECISVRHFWSDHLETTMNFIRWGCKPSPWFCSGYICTNEELNLSANTISVLPDSQLWCGPLPSHSAHYCDLRRSFGPGEPKWTRSVLTFYLCFYSQCAVSRVQLNACWGESKAMFLNISSQV